MQPGSSSAGVPTPCHEPAPTSPPIWREKHTLDVAPYVGHPTFVRKTSVYLTVDEAEGLRRLSAREGRPQAELIREGIRRVLADASAPARTFRSLGVGSSDGRKPSRWTSEELYRKVMGQR